MSADLVQLARAAHAEGRCRLIAINNSYQLAPEADVLYFADAAWWQLHHTREAFTAFVGQKCTIEGTGSEVIDGDIHMLRNAGVDGLSKTPDALTTGLNGGFQALGFAIAAGAARIILLGYDMRFVDGKSHWHGGHEDSAASMQWYEGYIRSFKKLKLPDGVQVLNATPGSALKCFPRVTLESVLTTPQPA